MPRRYAIRHITRFNYDAVRMGPAKLAAVVEYDQPRVAIVPCEAERSCSNIASSASHSSSRSAVEPSLRRERRGNKPVSEVEAIGDGILRSMVHPFSYRPLVGHGKAGNRYVAGKDRVFTAGKSKLHRSSHLASVHLGTSPHRKVLISKYRSHIQDVIWGRQLLSLSLSPLAA